MKRSRTPIRILSTRRGRVLAALLTAVVGSLLFASAAFANWDVPKSGGSPNANSEETLYLIVSWVGLFVFVAVEGALLYAIWRFRAKKHPVAEQFHGNTKLELGLTAGAATILVVLAAATFITLPSIINPPNSNAAAGAVLSANINEPSPPNGKKLTICVVGRQFIWQYVYGAGCKADYFVKRLPYSYQEMVVPAGITVDLVVNAKDVTHDWWVPELGGKIDAVPGYTTYTWFKALKAGVTYYGQCAQLCGRGHAYMTALVKVVTPSQYRTWVANQSQLINDQNDQLGKLRQDLVHSGQLLSTNGAY
ncbi:MAG TPA: cytochrome c oxidase subunit II [Solirubrobacteraceae bacterium]|nr:cytochrome c oxidase subunit II [Solirubrobacteraceae bacterium]